MARENFVYLLGAVAREPLISKKPGDDASSYAMCYVNVGRGNRDVGDGQKNMRCDNPMIMTRDPRWVEEISTWHTHDIVQIKGTIATKQIKKASYCKYCGTKNVAIGMLVYIHPIFAWKICHLDSPEACLRYIADHREISNQVFLFGKLVKDPARITTKKGLDITQYPVEMWRKAKIRSDDPSVRADYPYVKSYGENAVRDITYLEAGSDVYVDGCLQARSVLRHIVCGQSYKSNGKPEKGEDGKPRMRAGPDGKIEGCGRPYDWVDRAMEVVPYSGGVEYIGNYKHDPAPGEQEGTDDP